MHIIEQRDTVVLTNGEGSPRNNILLQAVFVLPIAIIILIAHVWMAMDGWVWGWLAIAIVPPVLVAFLRSWRSACHATVEIDRRFGRVRVERRFAHKTLEEKLSLLDVEALDIDTREDGDGDLMYTPMLALKDGRRIGLGPSRNDRAPIDRAIATVGHLD